VPLCERIGVMDVEEALLRAFIVPERRKHYVARLATPKTRKKLLGSFYHLHDLDPRFAHKLKPSLAYPSFIYEELRRRGAPDRCYVMSPTSDIDGQESDLREALEAIIGRVHGTFLSCVPGRLGYFEGEELNERYILERPAP
jgi:hypothetical protein